MPDPRYQGWTRDTSKLTPHRPQWNSGETKPYRLPITLADRILEYARLLDSGDNQSAIPADAIAAILTKIDQKLPGYRANSASQLIKDLKTLK